MSQNHSRPLRHIVLLRNTWAFPDNHTGCISGLRTPTSPKASQNAPLNFKPTARSQSMQHVPQVDRRFLWLLCRSNQPHLWRGSGYGSKSGCAGHAGQRSARWVILPSLQHLASSERLQPQRALPPAMPALGLGLNKSKKPTHTQS